MRIKSFIPIFLLITCLNASGQTSDATSSVQNREKREITARFNFIGLLDPYDENLSFGAEYKFMTHWSTGMDIAYIFRSDYLPKSKLSQGYNLSPFIRYYYPRANGKTFLEAALRYKHVSYQLEGWVGKDIVDGLPSYEEYSTFHYLKNVYEINFKTGTTENLTRDKRLACEFYLGLGLRIKKQGSDNGSYYPDRNWLIRLYDPRYTTLTIPLGARLIYKMK